MKTLILILFSFTCFAQQQTRKFGIVEYTDTSDSIVIRKLVTKVINPKDGMVIKFLSPPDSARLLIPDDGFMYETTMSFKRVGTIPPVEPPTTNPDLITSIDSDPGDVRNLYQPAWVHTANAGWTQVFHGKTVSYNGVTNATLTTKFDGYKIEWWSEKRLNHGKVAISIDGGAEVEKDLYDSRSDNNTQLIWTSEELTSGQHEIKLRVTGLKADAATAAIGIHDRFVVYKKQ